MDRLLKKSTLNLKEDYVYYCYECEKYLFEANVLGDCPHCEHRVNAECEHCYKYFHEGDLKNPTCCFCKKKPHLKKLLRYYFPLNKFRHIIENLYFKNAYSGISKSFVEKILSNVLPDIPMTIIAEQGIPFGENNWFGHVLYSAVELIPRFLVSLKIFIENRKISTEWELFLESKNVNLHLLFGVDNLYLRCIIFPILLSEFNNNLVNNINFIVNDFYHLNNSKFSTSRNHAISIEEIKDSSDLDYLRYYLAMTRPEFYSTNFCMGEFKKFEKDGVLKNYMDLVYILENKIAVKFNNMLPEAGSWDNLHYAYQNFLNANIPLASLYSNPSCLNITYFISLINVLMSFTINFFTTGMNLEMNESCSRTFYALCIKGIVSISILISPICPTLSKNIQSIFYRGIDNLNAEHLNKWISEEIPKVKENNLNEALK
ncbi:MAG: hypothetical protein EPO11_04960 [Gammaproteobacteria bacterium]|nr:MAG: hypothetical protein EPO11_04960 [Gammaproteobacteria bacterium]